MAADLVPSGGVAGVALPPGTLLTPANAGFLAAVARMEYLWKQQASSFNTFQVNLVAARTVRLPWTAGSIWRVFVANNTVYLGGSQGVSTTNGYILVASQPWAQGPEGGDAPMWLATPSATNVTVYGIEGIPAGPVAASDPRLAAVPPIGG